LGLAIMSTMRAYMLARPTFSARIRSAPLPLMVPPMTGSPVVFPTRHRLAGDQGLVDLGATLEHGAVDGDAFSGTHAQPVADLDDTQGHLFVGAVGADAAGGLRGQVQHARPDIRRDLRP